jgi:hypothetical protein
LDNDDDNECDDINDDDDDDIDSANIPKRVLAVYASPRTNSSIFLLTSLLLSSSPAIVVVVVVQPYVSYNVTFLYIRIAADTFPRCPSAVSIELSSYDVGGCDSILLLLLL